MKFYGHEIVDHNRLTFGVEISGIDLDSIKPEDFTTLVVEHVMSNVGVEGFAIGEEFGSRSISSNDVRLERLGLSLDLARSTYQFKMAASIG